MNRNLEVVNCVVTSRMFGALPLLLEVCDKVLSHRSFASVERKPDMHQRHLVYTAEP